MTKTERTKLKKRSNLYTWLAIGFLILFGFSVVMNITHGYIENVEHPLLKILILLTVFVPIVVSWYFNLKSTQAAQKLLNEKRIIELDRDLIRLRHLWVAFKEGRFKKAKQLYYDINDDDIKKMCNGMLIGVSTQVDMDYLWDMNMNDQINRMLSYPE